MATTSITPNSKPVEFWLGQIEAAQKRHENWHNRGKKVCERYLDKSETDSVLTSSSHKMNVLWSNVQTIQPALYAKSATPKVHRRFRDKDAVGRWAATVLERAEAYELDAYDDDYHYRCAILDYLLPGRGQVWVYYKPTFKGKGPAQQIEWECCNIRHLNWRDFLTNAARTWDEVWWVAKREYLSKEQAEAQGLNTKDLTFAPRKDNNDPSAGEDKTPQAAVWEIWDKTSGKVFFVSRSSPELLKPAEAPGLHLEGFFPCPRPLTTTTTTDSIIPIPDFCQYQNQAEEIDRLTQRINILTKALRVVGLYDAAQESLGTLLDGDENMMIPCTTWAVLAGNGGLEGSVNFFPLKDIITALQQCYVSRDQAKVVMYEITGISDIVRGATDPNETATAQQIKSQWGGLRIRDRQHEVQRFIRDVMRIKAEIHAEVFQPETLKTMSNVPLLTQAEKQQLQQRQQVSQQAQQMAQAHPQEAQAALLQNPQLAQLVQPLPPEMLQKLREPAWEEVVQLLRDDKLRGFRIDIETDSTIQGDEEAERTARTEYLTATTAFVTAWGPMVMQQPKFAGLAGELLLFGSRAFKVGDALESAIEEAVDALNEQALQPQPQQADPKLEADKQRMAMEDKHHQDTIGLETKKHGDEMALRQQEMQASTQADLQKHEMTTRADLHKHGVESGLRQQELSAQQQNEQTSQANDMEKHRGEQATKQSVAKSGQTQVTAPDGVFEELAQTIETKLDEFLTGMQAIMQAATAPKQITATIETDRNGKRTINAVARPQMGSPQGSA